jgi:DNA-binding MltR family transcriptional regulator
MPQKKKKDDIPRALVAKEFSANMRAETDRGAVLVGAALLDELLGETLSAKFIASQKATEKMLEHPGPCSTFAARTDIAYCLGLISSDVAEDLHLVRKLRNEFAHSPWSASFDDNEISARSGQLNVVQGMRRRGSEITMTARGKFEFAVAVLASHLCYLAEHQKHATEAPPLTRARLLDPSARNPLGY